MLDAQGDEEEQVDTLDDQQCAPRGGRRMDLLDAGTIH